MERTAEDSSSENALASAEAVVSHHDWSTTHPSRAVVDAVATVEGTDPVALSAENELTLYNYVDPEALDALVAVDRPMTLEISFEIDHLRVRIGRDGRLVVGPSGE